MTKIHFVVPALLLLSSAIMALVWHERILPDIEPVGALLSARAVVAGIAYMSIGGGW